MKYKRTLIKRQICKLDCNSYNLIQTRERDIERRKEQNKTTNRLFFS